MKKMCYIIDIKLFSVFLGEHIFTHVFHFYFFSSAVII